MRLKIGSLFSGYGGLDMGVQAAIGGEVVWHVEFDDAPSRILEHHWPDVPNFGDVTKVPWWLVEPIDVLTLGFPCQDLSLIGRRSGMRPGTRSGLWSDALEAIKVLRPKLVVIENVRGLLSGCAESEADSELGPCPRCADPDSGVGHAPNVRALGRVLIDLASVGYVGQWAGIRAADAGAPHGRFRVFVVAYPDGGRGRGWPAAPGHSEATWSDSPTDGSDPGAHRAPLADAEDLGQERAWIAWNGRARLADGGSPSADPGRIESERRGVDRDLAVAASCGQGAGEERERDGDATVDSGGVDWGEYEPAIRRWEHQLGRLAPAPTSPDGRDGKHKLSALFVEWMMGLPEGHVTAPEIGLTRSQEMKALGNGVVPQQANLAVRLLLSRAFVYAKEKAA